jgi:hypothetical protein
MQLVGNFIYCCAGLNGYNILNQCERFDLVKEVWTTDVPSMEVEKFSMTLMVLDKKWLYSFGGATLNFQNDLTGFEIERLDTEKLVKWERIYVNCEMKSCCQ